MKILCMKLAEGNINEFKRLFETEQVSEVYELLSIKNAINYRVEEKKNEQHPDFD
jgi:hypothetical protein